MKYTAENGGNGKGSNMHGKNGGSCAQGSCWNSSRDEKTNLVIADLSKEGDTYVVARGGRRQGKYSFQERNKTGSGICKSREKVKKKMWYLSSK